MITLVLPYPVSANKYWRTRVAKINGTLQSMTYVSAEAKAYKDQVGWLAKAAGVRAPITGRVAIAYTLHPHCPKDAHRRMKRDPHGWDDTVQCIDLDNAQKVLLDALKGVCMEDDKWVRRITAERGMPVEGGKLVVTITPMQAAPSQEQEQVDLLGALS